MSKQKIDKKKEICNEKSITNFISSNEVSECQDDTKENSIAKPQIEFLYYTPSKKKQLYYLPSTPKKPKRTYNYEGLVGRNLTIIFESME